MTDLRAQQGGNDSGKWLGSRTSRRRRSRVLRVRRCLSLAGEDRGYVNPIAVQLRESGVRVFYDEFEQSAMWGEDLVVFLDTVFRKNSRYAVVFISRHYVEKKWPTHEGRSAHARALVEDSPYFLPVRLDDSELPSATDGR